MRHYEVVYLVHPNESGQVDALIDKHQQILAESDGKFHRLEQWGRREMAYAIRNVHKAFYVLMNIECDQQALQKIEASFKFNDNILRNLVIRRQGPITQASFVVQEAHKAKEEAGSQSA